MTARAEQLETGWRRVFCFFGQHKFSIIGRCGITSQHVGCRRCGREWGMNHDVRAFLPWNEVAGFHEEHGYDAAAHRRAWLRAQAATEQGA